MSSPNVTTLDLHGKRLEEAISEVTLFLERIRRTVAASSRSRGASVNLRLYCQIITGSGSHSSHGPVLRSAVQTLLEKRGMDFSLEHGGGCFRVDALSGWDLYAQGPATDSKVLVSNHDEFHQLAMAKRKNNAGANFAQAAMSQPAVRSSPPRRAVSVSSKTHNHRSSSNPLPAQVAVEDSNVRAATKLSNSESQQQRNQQNEQDRLSEEYDDAFQIAISESQIDQGEPKQKSNMEEEDLKLAYERSISDERDRTQLTEEQYEDALMLAIEESAQDVNNDFESEDDLIEQALAESRALAEEEQANNNEDALLEKAIAESMLAEERRKAFEQVFSQGEHAISPDEEERMLQEVLQLSLQQEEDDATEEEVAMQRAIEMSKHLC